MEGRAGAMVGHAPEAGVRTLELLEGARSYNRWLFDRLSDAIGQRVLEVGCGTGTITQFLADRELVVGVEVVPEYLQAARIRFDGAPNVLIQAQDISRSVAGLESFRFDSALAVNVLEHIDDDRAAVRAVFSLLQPGGRFAVLSPAHPWLMSPFDRAIGHYRRYTKAALRQCLESAGFEVIRLRRSNPVGALGWLVNNRLLRRRALAAVSPFDRIVPVLAALDRLGEPPLGLSLVAIARKPIGSRNPATWSRQP